MLSVRAGRCCGFAHGRGTHATMRTAAIHGGPSGTKPQAAASGSFGLSCACEGVAQVLLLRLIERGSENRTSRVLDLTENLVGGHILDQQEENRVSRFHTRCKLLHELVSDAEIGQRTAQRAGAGPESHTNKRIEEHQPKQQPPQTPGCGACHGRVHELIEFYSFAFFDSDYGIIDRDQILALELEYFLPNFLCLGFRWVHDRN